MLVPAVVLLAATGALCSPAGIARSKRQASLADMPPINEITLGAPALPTPTLAALPAGSTPPVPGAPAIPTTEILEANYPPASVVPPTDSTQVKQWLSEIDLSGVPNIPINDWNAGDPCSVPGNSAAVASSGASGSCWWTCGGCNRDQPGEDDITTCNDKNTWGLTYDDGPSDYTPLILEALDKDNLHATFFVVGSAALWRPDVVRAEMMAGHHIAAHTWSHSVGLTGLTNEQIVAELRWSQQIIKDQTGVTPLYTRAPWGDVDDRVRAVMKACGLTPIMWTQTAAGADLDTNDWEILTGANTGQGALDLANNFDELADSMPSGRGYISLEHDLYQQEVDVAVGYILPAALAQTSPKLSVKSVVDCIGLPITQAYKETFVNGSSSGSTPPAFSQSSSPSSLASSPSSTSAVASKAASSISSSSPSSSAKASTSAGTSSASKTSDASARSTRLSTGALLGGTALSIALFLY